KFSKKSSTGRGKASRSPCSEPLASSVSRPRSSPRLKGPMAALYPIAALHRASLRLVAHRAVERVVKNADISKTRFGVDLDAVAGEPPEQKRAIIADADGSFAAAAGGVPVV